MRRRPAGQARRLLLPVVFLAEFAGKPGSRGDDGHGRVCQPEPIVIGSLVQGDS